MKRFDRIVEEDQGSPSIRRISPKRRACQRNSNIERRGIEAPRRCPDQAHSGRDGPSRPIPRLLRMTLFNLLIGNNDNHAKNHALLHRPGEAPELAPC